MDYGPSNFIGFYVCSIVNFPESRALKTVLHFKDIVLLMAHVFYMKHLSRFSIGDPLSCSSGCGCQRSQVLLRLPSPPGWHLPLLHPDEFGLLGAGPPIGG